MVRKRVRPPVVGQPADLGIAVGERVDLLIRGGHVVDPASGVDDLADVAISDGRIRAVAPDLSMLVASSVVPAAGLIVTPGLVDVHAHCVGDLAPFAMDVDAVGVDSGCTTVVDAGSVGWPLVPALVDRHREAKTRLLAFVNISTLGLLPTVAGVSELVDRRLIQVSETVAAIEQHREVMVGVKIRIDGRVADAETSRVALRLAKEVAADTRTVVMVHLHRPPLPPSAVLDELDRGDVVTHAFDSTSGLMGENGAVAECFVSARERGVRFDVGHAGVHCDVQVLQAALEQGFAPDTIGSDRHRPPPGRVTHDIPELVSLMIALGIPMSDAVAMATSHAADLVGRSGVFGSLAPGAIADVTVLRRFDERLRFAQASHDRPTAPAVFASEVYRPHTVVAAGRIIQPGR